MGADSPELTGLTLAADPERWAAAGFAVSPDETPSVVAGAVRMDLAGAGAGRGIVHWTLAGIAREPGDLDGLPTEAAVVGTTAAAAPHPNGVTGLDHVVAFSPDLERTIATLKGAGLDFRRLREGPTAAGAQRQAFFRVGRPLLEVIEHPPGVPAGAGPSAPSRFWGLALAVDDLDASAASLGELLGQPRAAIQPGRRIATFARTAGLGLPVALITV